MTGLHLTALTLAQFRSYDHAALSLDGRPVVLHGPNGAGKTNILEAVSLLSPGRGLRGAVAADVARAPGALGWRVRATVADGEGAREIVITGEPTARRRVEIDGKAETQGALGCLIPMLWLTPAMDRLWIEGAEGRRRFIDRAALSFSPDHATHSLRFERAMRERNRLLRDGPAEPAWLDALEAQMADSGAAVAEARAAAVARLMAAQQGAKTLFPNADIAMIGSMEQRFQGENARGAPQGTQLAEIAAEYRSTLARGRQADAAAGRTLTGPHRSDLTAQMATKGVAARQCSTGEQKALLLSLVLANARALAEGGVTPVILLDEVAAHLDAERRSALFDAVCAQRVQAFMTGTGPELFTAIGARAQAFAVAEAPSGSRVEAA